MTVLNFPASPSINETYTENGVTYVWTGTYWTANSQAFNDVYVNIGGDTMTGNLTVPSLNGGQLAGFRNQIINGAVIVDQRTAGFVNSGDYGADRWLPYSGDSQMSRSRITDLPGFSWALSVRNTAGATTGKAVRQGIELIDSTNTTAAPFVEGAVYTHSFWCRQRNGSTVDASDFGESNIQFADGVMDTSNVSSPNTATAFVQIESVGNWRRFARQVTIDQTPNVGNACLRVNISAFAGTEMSSAEGVFYTGVQLEPGPVATPFELRPIGTELALCQRYFQKLVLQGGTVSMGNDSDRTARTPQRLSTKMRDTPTVENLVKDTAATRILQNGNTTTVSAPSQVIARADDLIEVNTIAANGSLATVRYTNASVDLVAEL